MAGAPTAQGTHTRRLPALLDLLRRTVAEARADGERRLAAETTYYAFFSLFPLMMILVSALDAVVSRKTRDEIVDSLIGQFPVIGDDIAASVATPQGRGLAAAVGLLLALWAGSHAFESFGHAITVVWKGPAVPPTSMLKSRLRALVPMAILGVAIVVTTVVGSILAGIDTYPLLTKPISFLVSLALNTGVVLLVFKVLAPGHPTWGSQFPGAVVAGVGWTILQIVGAYFVRYVVKGASDTYGTFAVVIGMLTWINIQIRMILWAAELNTVIADPARR